MGAKITLIIVGILVIVMGFLGFVPSIGLVTQPLWLSIAQIVIGLLAAIVGLMSKRAQ